MLSSPDGTLTLLEPADLDGAAPPALGAHAAALREVLDWARDYLCHPHAELGRRGNVCPYAQSALDRQTFLLAVRPGRPSGPDEIAGTLIGYRDWFEAQCRADEAGAQYRTIVVVFPDLGPDEVRTVVDGAQDRLKADYVARGLMLGEFHDGPPDKAGLWNPDFRPLRSPVPLLAIRQMVPTDFAFLADDPEHVAAYVARFGDRVPAHLRDTVRAAVDRFGLDTRDSAEPAGDSVALSPLQQRLWFLNQLDPGNPVQHVAAGFRLRGPLDPGSLAAALDAVVADEPVLRTTLAERDGQPVAVIAAKTPAPLTVVDLSRRADPEGDAARRARAAARRPFDLRRGPLLRGLLLALGAEDHLLVLTAHRLVADETSLRLVAGELDHRVAGPRPVLAPPDDPAALSWWAGRLSGLSPLTLPTDRPRPAAQSYRGGVHRGLLPADVLGSAMSSAGAALSVDAVSGVGAVSGVDAVPGVGAVSGVDAVPGVGAVSGVDAVPGVDAVSGVDAAPGADAETVLVAGLAVVLGRHAGQREVALGIPVDVRPSDRPGAVGPLTATVVLRVELTGPPGFRELCRRVAAGLAEARAHAGAPFERVVEALDVERSLDRSPLVDVHVALRPVAPPLRVAGLAAEPVGVPTGAAPVDLSVEATPDGAGGLALALTYAADLMDPETVGRLAGHLETVLRHAAADPDAPVETLSLLTAAERARALGEWQGPVLPLPAPAAAWTLIERWVRDTPDAVAVSGPDGELTYGELHRRAAQLAHVLRAWGVGPEVPVGLCVERSAAMVVALLGVWLAGGAYLPLDPGFPPDRLRAMLDDAGAEVVVTSRAARERLAGLLDELPGVIDLDGDADVLAAQPTVPPAGVRTDGDSLAYLIYTSGSTGRPKGVEVPHRAVANLLVAFDRALRLTPADRWLAVTTVSFDIAALELLLPLASGARVVVAGSAETGDGPALRRRAADSGATVLQATPTTWRLLLGAGGVPDPVRLRLCGGEVVPRDLADALAGPTARVWNVYGPTETTVWSAAGVVASAPAPVEIGPPVANTTMTVLDPYGEPVPVGVVGEVHIGGLGVARGYRGLPELTARRFLPGDPAGGALADGPEHPAAGGGRRYATGDLARWRPNGRLEFLGRADDQVKVRGFRIELGDLESALRADPEVRDAVASTWSGGDGDTRLVAYVVPAAGGTDGLPERLRERLRAVLPDYLLPSGIEPIDALPQTPNGKVDRRALPEPRWGAAGAAATRRAARTAVERALVGLWSEVLGVDGLGVDDDFFALGGHSLLGARLLARVRGWFHTDVPTRSLFDSPTVAGMAAVLLRMEAEPGQAEAIAEAREAIDALSPEEVEAMLAEDGP